MEASNMTMDLMENLEESNMEQRIKNRDIRECYKKTHKNLQYCNECREKREEKYKELDTDMNGNYSRIELGMTSPQLKSTPDILIISESHGGGDKKRGFKKQGELSDELREFYDYYMNDEMTTLN